MKKDFWNHLPKNFIKDLAKTLQFLRAIFFYSILLSFVSCGPGGDLIDKLVGVKGDLENSGGIGNDALVFNPNPLDFGNLPLGGTAQTSGIVVRNNAKLAIKILDVTNPSTSSFSVSGTNCDIGKILQVQDTCIISVQFDPSIAGTIDDNIKIDFAPEIDETLRFSNRGNLKGTAVGLLNFAGANAILPADVSTTRVTVRWLGISGASSFAIYDMTGGTAVQVGSAPSSATSFTLTGLSPNTSYSFRVNALNVLGLPDTNTVDRAVTTDNLGAFTGIPNLAANEGSAATTLDLAGYCTDAESNLPQLIVINSQSDPDLNCVLLTTPYRVQCTPNFKNGAANWSGTVGLGCLLNDYGVPYSTSMTVNVNNIYRAPALASISGQNVTGGTAITPVVPSATSIDGEGISLSCRYDNLSDGSVGDAASLCTTLLNQGGGNATFTGAPVTLNWTPPLSAGGQTFEFRIRATGNSSGLFADRIFVVNVGYPPPSPTTSLLTVSSGAVNSGSAVTVTLQARDADGNNIPVGGATVTFAASGGSSTGTFSSVTDNGNGTYTATFTGVLAGTATNISATINGSNVTSPSPSITVSPGGISRNTSTISVSSSTVQSGSNITLTLTARDAAGNLLTTGGAAVVFNRSGGTSTGTISATTDVTNGTYTATFTGVVAGTATSIGATINTLAVTTTLPSVTVTPGVVSLAESIVTVIGNPTTVTAGNSIQVLLRTKDAAGNNITSGGLAVTFGFSGGTSSGTFGSVADNADGTYSISLTGTSAGTVSQFSATIGGSAVTSTMPSLTVVPGGPSAAHSLVTVASATVNSGSTVLVTVVSRDAFSNPITTGGATVTFSRSGGTSTGTFSATTNVGNGTYTATFTGIAAGSATTINATINGSNITTTLPTITVNPGAISIATSTVSVSSPTVLSGSDVTLTLTARDAAGNLLTTGGSTVVFSRTGGASTGTISATTNVGDGTYTATFTGVLAGSATTIRATIGGSLVTSTPPTIQVLPGPISLATSTVSRSAATVNSGNSVTLTLSARDAAGNNLTSGGSTVLFSTSGGTSTGTISATTNVGDGTYTATFTGVNAGSATTISASVDGSPVISTTTVQVLPGAISAATSLVTVSSTTVNSGSPITITLQGRDAAGNSISTGGATVVFSRSGGTSTGTISATTNVGDGTYTATFTGVLAGTATTISATINGSSVTTTLPTVQVFPGSISPTTSLISASASTVSSGSNLFLTLQARDAAGNNLVTGGSTIVFGRSGGTSTGTISATTNVGDGTYTATFTGVLAGTATTITATIGGVSVTSTLPTVVVTPGPISLTNSILTSSLSTVASGNSTTLTVTTRDAAGNNLTTGGATVVFLNTGGSSTGTISATTDNSNGTYTASFTGVLAGSATTISATVGGTPLTSTTTITVVPGAISATTSTISVSSASITSGSTSTLTLTGRDAAGNLISAGGATVVFNRSGGTSTGTISATTNIGDGTYTATFTGVLAGTATNIGATIGGNPVSTAVPTITVTPGTISTVTSNVTVSSATVASGSDVTLTLQARDAAGNAIPTGGATVAFGRTGGTSTGTISATTNVGNGTYTATFTGVLAGTATTITATIGGTNVTSAMPTVTVTPGPLSLSQSLIAASSATVASGNNITLTLTAKDAAGNSLTSGGTAVIFTHTGGTSTGNVGATTDNSNGTYTATFTGVLAGTATTVSASAGGSAVVATTTVTVLPGGISPATSVISVSSSSILSGSTSTLTLQAKDAAGNNLSTGGSTVVFGRTGGTSTGTISATTNVGDGTYTATFTGVLAGTATNITATIGGTAVTTTLPTITVSPGPLSLAQTQILIDGSPTTVASGGSVTLRLRARDTAGNFILSGGSLVVFTYDSGTSTGTISATTDLTNGQYTATFTGAAAGTAVSIRATVGGSGVTSTSPTISVIPGAPSINTSTIAVGATTVQSGLTTTVTLTTRDAFGNSLNTGGATVAFSNTGGGSTGTFGATTDSSNGTYSAVFTGINSGTPTEIDATINGVTVTTASPSITVVPGPPSTATSILGVSSSSVLSGGNVTLTLTTYDAGGNAVTTGGQTVVFSFTGGTSTGSISATNDGANGIYTATFTGLTAGTATTIRATINGSLVATASPTIDVDPGAISATTSLVTVSSATVASGSNVTVTLTARDSNNNLIPTGGETVVFNRTTGGGVSSGSLSATTNIGNGTYTAIFTGNLVGTPTSFSATINGTPITTASPSVTVVPGPISLAQSTVAVSSSTIHSGSTSTLTLTGRDAAGNNLTAGGSLVVFTHSGGTSTGNISTTTDNGNGTYSATFTGLIAGTATTVNASISGSAVTSAMPTIVVNPGPASLSQSTLAVSSSSVSSGSSVTVTLTVRDAAGNQQSTGSRIVNFSNSGGSSTGSISVVTDNNNGTYTATFTGITAGTATTLSASIDGSNLSSTLPTVAVTAGPVSLAQSSITASVTSVASGSTSTLTVTVRDANNNVITGGAETIVIYNTGGSSTGNISAVSNPGNGTYSAIFTGLVSGTATTINATINGSLITSAFPSITVNPGGISLAQSTIAVSSSSVASGSAVTLTLTARDANGNQQLSGGSSVVFGRTGGTSTGTIGATTDHGNGTYSATFTGTLAGTATSITASIGGSSVTSTLPTVTVIPGPASLANSSISVSAATLASGTAGTLTLTARDSAGNQLSTGGLTVVFARSGGTSTGTIGATVDNNNGTYSASFNALVAGSATNITATIGGSPVTSSSPTMTVVPGAISAAHSVVTVSSGTVQSGLSATITLHGRDVNNNSLTSGGATVVFSRTGGTSTGTVSATTTVGDGTYTATFTGLASGTATTINATINATAVTTTMPTVQVVPGPASLSASTVTLSSSTVSSGSAVTVTLTTRDAGGNALTTGGTPVTFGLNSGSSSGAFSAVTDNANGTYTATFTGLASGTPAFVEATLGGSAITSTLPTIQVLVGPFSASNSTVTLSSGTVGAGSTVTATLTVRDINNNPFTSGTGSVTFGLSGGTSNGTFGPVTDNNNGTYSVVITGTTVGTGVLVGANYNAVAISSSLPTLVVTAGAISPVQSLVSVSSSSTASGSTSTLTLTARDAFGNSILTGGQTIGFSFSGGTSTGSIGAVTDVGNGTYTAVFTGVLAGSTTTINATINGTPVSSSLPTITVTPGPLSLSQSVISVSSGSVIAGNTVNLGLQAKDAAGNNIATSVGVVLFSQSGGTSNGTFSAVTDNGNGTYSATFTGTTSGTATTINATIGGSSVSSSFPTVTVIPGAISVAHSLVTVSSATVASGSAATLTLQAKDAYGNNIPTGSATVLFSRSGGSSNGNISATTDNNNGTYTATFTGTTSGTATTINATIGGAAVTTALPTLTVVPGAISLSQSLVSVSTPTVGSGSTATLTLQAKDSAGNNLTSGGTPVVFTRSGGFSNGTIGSTTDNGDGTYSALFTATTSGTPTTIGANISGSPVLSTLPTITVNPGPASLSQSLISVSSNSVPSGSAVTVTLQARDAAGNNLTSGTLSVAFSRSGGISNGNFSAITDNGNGTYTATFTGSTSGSATTITGTIGGSAITSALPTVTVTPGPFSLSQSEITLGSTTVNSGSGVLVTLQARDAAGNNLSGSGLTVAFNRSGGVSNGTFSLVNDLGGGVYTSTFTGTTSGSATTITATINGSAVTSTLPSITVNPGPASLAQSTVSISSATVASGSNVTLTLQTRDAAGNNLTSGTLSVAFNRSGGTSTGTIGPVTDNGNGTYTATFTGVSAGTATNIGATIGGASVTSFAPTITVIPGAVSLAQSVISVDSPSVASGSGVFVRLQAKDSNGNNLTSSGLTVVFGRSGGTSTGTISATTDNLDGTYRATFTGDLAGTATGITATIGGFPVTSISPTLTVVPGAVSLSQTTISVSSATIASGATTTATVQTRDAAGNNITVGGTAVVFGTTGGTSTGTFAATSDNSNGTYTALFTGTTAGTATTVTATFGGSPITSTPPTITVTPGASTAANSVVSVSSSTVTSGNSVTLTLQARDASNNNITVGGSTVTFGFSGGSSAGNITAFSDNGNGTYTATLTGTSSGTPSTVTAIIDGTAVTSSLPTVQVNPGVVSVANSTVSVSSSSVSSGSSSIVTLQAKDAYNNNLISGGLTVAFGRSGGVSNGTFSSVTDNGNGTYTATFTGTTSGAATTITATISGTPVSSTLPTVTVNPGAFSLANSTVTVSSGSILAGATSTLTLTTRDAANNALTSGTLAVTFFRTGGLSNGTIGSVTDNGNGTYTATFTGTTSGNATSIGANINGSPITSTLPTILVNPGAISVAHSIISVSSNSIASGTTSTLNLQAKDAYGNNLTSSSSTVVFSRSGGTSNGTFSAVTNVGDGTFTGVFTGTTAGTATTIGATVDGTPVSTTLPTITVIPGAVSLAQSTVELIGNPSSVASGASVTARVTARDGSGNQLNAGGLLITFSRAGGTSTGSFGAVTDNNNGTYDAVFTGATAGTPTAIRADIGGSLMTSTFPTLQVTPGPVSLLQSTATASVSPVQSGSMSTLTVTARDANGNQQSGGGLIISFNASGGTSTGTISSVTDNLNGTYTATFTGVVSGTATTLTGRIGGVDLTSTAPTIQVTPGPISPATSFITLAATSVSSGNAVLVTLNGRDVNGNDVPSSASVVAFSRSGGSSTGNFSVTTNFGDGDYGANFQGITAGTPTTISATIDGVPVSTTLPEITVTPGAVSLSNSLVTVSSGTILSGASTLITVTPRDINNNLLPASQTVTIGNTGGTSTGNISAVTNVGNGTYTATFTGVVAGTATTITAGINGSAVTATLPTIAVDPGAVSVAQSIITVINSDFVTGSDHKVIVGTTATLVLTARDANGNQLLGTGLVIAFSASGGTSNGTIAAVVAQGNGVYHATYTATTFGTPDTVFATIGGASVSYPTAPSIEVITPPALAGFSSRLYSSTATNPLRIGENISFDLYDSIVGDDTGVTYTCVFDRTFDLAMAAEEPCDNLPGFVSFDTSTGIFSWTPDQNAWGNYEVRFRGTNLAGINNAYSQIQTAGDYPLSNLFVDIQGDYFRNYRLPGVNPGMNNANGIINLNLLAPILNGATASFAGSGTSGFSGTGAKATPHALFFDGNDDQVSWGTTFTSSNYTVSAWIRPDAPRTQVNQNSFNKVPDFLFDSGGLFSSGLSIIQSPAEGEASAFGPAKYELAVGLNTSWVMTSHRTPFVHYRFNGSPGANLGDVAGSSRQAEPRGLTAVNTSTVDGALSATGRNRGDEDSAMLFPGGGPSATRQYYEGQTRFNEGTWSTIGGYEIWFKTRATPTLPVGDEHKFGALVAFSDNGTNPNFRPSNCDARNDKVLYMDAAGHLYFKYRVDKGSVATNYVIKSTNTFADTNWHHVMVIWDRDAEGMKLYVNGELEASDTAGLPWTSISNHDNNDRLKIGGAQFRNNAGTVCNWLASDTEDGITGSTFAAGQHYAAFDGALDEFRLYRDTGVITQTLVQQRFNSTRCQTTTTFNFNAPVDQNWYHLTATYDSVTRVGKLFVNGVEECSATYPAGTLSAPSRPLILGGRGFFRNAAQTATTGFQGGLGDFKLYETALPPTEVLKIYDETKNRFPGH